MSAPSLANPPPTSERRPIPRDVWRKYVKSGHGSALENSLVEQHLPLVKTVVGRLAVTLPQHVSTDDLYSAGLVGLLNAIRRFSPKGGASFESYARVRIRGAVFDELRRLDWVPRSVHDKAKKVEQTMHELAQRQGSIPTDDEMADALGLSAAEYQDLLDVIRPATYVCLDSVHMRGDGENGTGSHDLVADESQINPGDAAAKRELSRLIEARLQQLPEMQRKVLALYYFEDLRLREIAEAFGVTESRICQVHAQAILAIKALLRRQNPEVFGVEAQTDT
jgi:RNA polymerase sigma factor for flagellar operon FliA